MWALENDGQWSLEDDWKVRILLFHSASNNLNSSCQQAHDATITKLSWAHPTFGTVLASGSFDRSVKIWEQTHGEADSAMPHGPGGSKPDSGNSRWVERSVLLDAKGSIRAVEFAPHHFGLKLVRSHLIASDAIGD